MQPEPVLSFRGLVRDHALQDFGNDLRRTG